MTYTIVRTPKEIDELLNQCVEAEAEGTSQFPSMTFEEEIDYAIKWLTDKSAPYPLEN